MTRNQTINLIHLCRKLYTEGATFIAGAYTVDLHAEGSCGLVVEVAKDLCPECRGFKSTSHQVPQRCTEHGTVPTYCSSDGQLKVPPALYSDGSKAEDQFHCVVVWCASLTINSKALPTEL